ncbi:unnamed protein product [Somion occarium]|uniref:NADPH-dependent FMN reductase-like domain-containing protein n=1 Tax=Somion occarium TaxID=3059160 RepID=A0ABP1CLV7_9APHY
MGVITRKIGLILGSARTNGNGAGLASWVSPIIQRRLNKAPLKERKPFEVVTVDPTAPPHPLGPLLDGSRFPAQVTDPEQYPSPAIREWSRFVTSCSALVILTPEYNGAYPGELKNALDHLYYEWQRKPVLLITYGASGGGRCAKQLTEILTGLKMQVVSDNLQISLPKEYIGGSERVVPGRTFDFLSAYEAAVEKAAGELGELTSSS